MDTILLMVIPFIGYVIAYHTYGKFLARKIFNIDPNATTPAHHLNDGIDFVPTKKGILFGHHYTSIAGTGPIVGPAIGIIWGWIPALLWIFLGSIFMGAVHDFGSLVISLRNEGKSISECTAKYISNRVRLIFFLIVFLALLIVIAIFGLVIAIIFAKFPESVFPVWMQIPIAVTLGWIIYSKQKNITLFTIFSVLLMYGTILIGTQFKPTLGTVSTIPATGIWTIILMIYAFFASTLSVKTLLQPRDYINAWQLLIAMGLLILGIIFSSIFGNLHIVAPAVNFHPKGAPPIWPFLFITIACGAISGFHSLVSSGTSSKQIEKKTDALFVGYGSMLVEAALSTLIIITVGAGIGLSYKLHNGTVLTGHLAFSQHYASWQSSAGLGSKLNAVVIGAANMIGYLGIPHEIGIVIMGVFIASFAGTTLDTATRIQRYIVTEIFSNTKIAFMTNRFLATAFAVLTAAALAFISGADGKGALTLWPMFGSVNQLLASLTLLVITVYLKKQGGLKFIVTAIPCLAMLSLTLCSVVINEINFIKQTNYLLSIVNAFVIGLSIWMIIEGIIACQKP